MCLRSDDRFDHLRTCALGNFDRRFVQEIVDYVRTLDAAVFCESFRAAHLECVSDRTTGLITFVPALSAILTDASSKRSLIMSVLSMRLFSVNRFVLLTLNVSPIGRPV